MSVLAVAVEAVASASFDIEATLLAYRTTPHVQRGIVSLNDDADGCRLRIALIISSKSDGWRKMVGERQP